MLRFCQQQLTCTACPDSNPDMMPASKDAGIVLPCMLAMAEILADGDVLLSRADDQEQDNHIFSII